MKTNIVSAALVLSAMLAGNCLAVTEIDETFDALTLDTVRWSPFNFEKGRLKQADKKLNYVVGKKSTPHDYASIELNTSQPGYTENWEVIVDLANDSGKGKDVACGIMLFHVQERYNYLFLDFYGEAGISAGVLINKNDKPTLKGKFGLPVGLKKASVRIRFNGQSKLMTFSASLTAPDKKYKWIDVGTFSPTGSLPAGVKKVSVKANWKMAATDRFGVQLYGISHAVKVPSGKVTFDNLTVTALP